tara:strand:+ start:548 stop:1705 length:1158 start_codon:yes stop_codon:yes gene_type:complete
MDSQNNYFDTLKEIIKDVKTTFDIINDYGFFQRLFAWNVIKKHIIKINSKIDNSSDTISNIQTQLSRLDELKKNEATILKKDNEIKQLRDEVTKFRTTKEDRRTAFDKQMAKYDNYVARAESKTQKEEDEKEKARVENENLRKVSWKNHEDDVANFITNECIKYGIKYVGPEEFPNNLKPDNAILISERYVIFDAKSPKDSEDTTSFIKSINTKVKQQTKYTKLKNVKKDIYLVVPTNLYSDLKKTHYQQGNYNVWIITIEQIPVMLAHFKQTMDYSDFDGLSPEDRDALVKEIGTYAFNFRRRLMIDGYFGSQFQDIIKNTKNNLSEELFNEVEQAVTNLGDSLPTKRSGKPLSIDDIDQEIKELNTRNQLLGIPTPPIEEDNE